MTKEDTAAEKTPQSELPFSQKKGLFQAILRKIYTFFPETIPPTRTFFTYPTATPVVAHAITADSICDPNINTTF